tara:strand:+ start:1993 stop:2589 length:597 start_codon:yes stop_codon:yes gene_type:complete
VKKETNKLEKIMKALPQLQCKKCNYDDCESYAQAILHSNESINKCEPGANQTENVLKKLIDGDAIFGELSIENYQIAHINYDDCIGCTICIKSCPVDAIIGARKKQHYIINDRCNGCELCIEQCPVDCMEMVYNDAQMSWIWPSAKSDDSRVRYYRKLTRIKQDKNTKIAINQEEKIKQYLKLAVEREGEKRKFLDRQ